MYNDTTQRFLSVQFFLRDKKQQRSNGKMELKMKREQFEKLLQMVYLGRYVVTSCRGAEKSVQGYDEVADMLYLKRYMAEAAISDCRGQRAGGYTRQTVRQYSYVF